MDRYVQAGTFKAECLKLMDEVNLSGQSIIITKRRIPVAKLVAIKKEKRSLFGKMQGTGRIIGDIVAPIGEQWDAAD